MISENLQKNLGILLEKIEESGANFLESFEPHPRQTGKFSQAALPIKISLLQVDGDLPKPACDLSPIETGELFVGDDTNGALVLEEEMVSSNESTADIPKPACDLSPIETSEIPVGINYGGILVSPEDVMSTNEVASEREQPACDYPPVRESDPLIGIDSNGVIAGGEKVMSFDEIVLKPELEWRIEYVQAEMFNEPSQVFSSEITLPTNLEQNFSDSTLAFTSHN